MTTLNDITPNVPVDELSEAEGRHLFERACKRHLSVSAEEFLRRRAEGSYPQDWPERAIQEVEFLLPFYG